MAAEPPGGQREVGNEHDALRLAVGEDLDADSLAVVEISLALNDAFSIKLPEVDPEQLQTVGQAFELVCGVIGA